MMIIWACACQNSLALCRIHKSQCSFFSCWLLLWSFSLGVPFSRDGYLWKLAAAATESCGCRATACKYEVKARKIHKFWSLFTKYAACMILIRSPWLFHCGEILPLLSMLLLVESQFMATSFFHALIHSDIVCDANEDDDMISQCDNSARCVVERKKNTDTRTHRTFIRSFTRSQYWNLSTEAKRIFILLPLSLLLCVFGCPTWIGSVWPLKVLRYWIPLKIRT